MKHEIYKFLTDRNPDGSVSYSQEDMEKKLLIGFAIKQQLHII